MCMCDMNVPVNEIFSIFICLAIAVPVGSPYPDKILTTPLGNPASLINSATFNADNGVYSDVFKTTVLPKNEWMDGMNEQIYLLLI